MNIRTNKKNNSTKLEKRIELQQRIIDELSSQNEMLEKKNEELQQSLEFEKSNKDEGYELAKKLMAQIEMYKLEYEKSIADAKKSKAEYDEAKEDFLLLKKEYQKKMDTLLKQIKKSI